MPLIDLVPLAWHNRLGRSLEMLRSIDDRLREDETNPPRELIFRALNVDPSKVKVVILGQDPYPNPTMATGLAFSIPPTTERYPPSLQNILSEYQSDLGKPPPLSGDLSPWVGEGVLLLNTVLTCRPGESLSHADIGWQDFTRAIIKSVNTSETVGILWGAHAQKYREYFASDMRIETPHPSPLSAYRGFFGSKPFSQTNDLLLAKGIGPIDWSLQSA